MPNRTGTKRTSRPSSRPAKKKPLDTVQNARRVVLESIGESEDVTVSMSLVSQVMAAMGRKGGKTGGKSRMAMLTAEEKTAMGKAAAEKRWGTKKS
jgi:hypothetical protein